MLGYAPHECILAPLQVNTFCTAVLHVTKKLILADAVFIDSMVQLQRKEEIGGKRDEGTAGRIRGAGRGGSSAGVRSTVR